VNDAEADVSALQQEFVRLAAMTVWNGIRDEYPEDFERLKYRIRRFVPHPNPVGGDVGEIIHVHLTPEEQFDHEAWEANPFLDEQVDVALVEDIIEPEWSRALIAHELGHVASTDSQVDVVRNRIVDDPEWASEALADLYMLKWSFDSGTEAMYAGRDVSHHRIALDVLVNHVDIVGN
jgi:hypothetical protein